MGYLIRADCLANRITCGTYGFSMSATISICIFGLFARVDYARHAAEILPGLEASFVL